MPELSAEGKAKRDEPDGLETKDNASPHPVRRGRWSRRRRLGILIAFGLIVAVALSIGGGSGLVGVTSKAVLDGRGTHVHFQVPAGWAPLKNSPSTADVWHVLMKPRTALWWLPSSLTGWLRGQWERGALLTVYAYRRRPEESRPDESVKMLPESELPGSQFGAERTTLSTDGQYELRIRYMRDDEHAFKLTYQTVCMSVSVRP